MNTKLIKDPVHGYIRIPKSYLKNVVDTCEFQRLRSIRQTSYDSLYPGSSHNRFIHSLGVFYLGKRAFKALKENVADRFQKQPDFWKECKITFELACLLHDIGHTPFSHVGEDFLITVKEKDKFEVMKHGLLQKESSEITKLYNELLEVMKARLSKEEFKEFKEDFAATILGSSRYDERINAAKPHEIMSVIIAMEMYEPFFKEEGANLNLFARAILGLQYRNKNKRKCAVYNALVQMLNSSIIDVDRLDYIMRDTQMTGFDSTSIDIDRLLDSVIIIKNDNDEYQLAYKKNAISTIENVILAYDAERRWIQGHPVVIYDSFLIKECLTAIDRKFKVKNNSLGIFQKDALKLKGVSLENGLRLRLLNDGDCLFLIKQMYSVKEAYYVSEYLARDKRKRPIWKSEAEFKLFLAQLNSSQQKIFMNIFNSKNEEKEKTSIGSSLDANRIKELKQEIQEMEKDGTLNTEDIKNTVLVHEKQLFWLEKLQEYFTKRGMEFQIQNMTVDTFNSKINVLSEGKVHIWFENFKKSKDISGLIKVYQTEEERKKEEKKEEIIYWFIYKSDSFDQDDLIEFIKITADEFQKKYEPALRRA